MLRSFILALTLFATLQPARVEAEVQPLKGLTNPSVSYGLSGIRDWMPIIPFIDIARVMRRWQGVGENGEKFPIGKLSKMGALDENGWVKKIPPGVKHIGTILAWQREKFATPDRVGRYVMTYDGVGDFRLTVDAKIISKRPGRIEFVNETGRAVGIDIHATDADHPKGHLRNIVITKARHRPLHEAGALFNPDWLALIADARQLRFMDWMGTNGSWQRTWDRRPKMTDAQWSLNRGVSVEVMVRLANEVGADPWFTMPHLADDAYVRSFAEYVRDHLDPRLKAHVEFSNELWNGLFSQTRYFAENAQKLTGRKDPAKAVATRAYEVAQIWSDVFGAEAEERLVNVLATWTMQPQWTKRLLETKVPNAGLLSSDTIAAGFDALAVTTYYGGKKQIINPTLKAWRADPAQAKAKLLKLLREADRNGSVPHLKSVLKRQRRIAQDYGLRMVQYEGGQHIVTTKTFSSGGEGFQNFLIDFTFSKAHSDLLQEVMADWREVGAGPFMQFGESYTPGRSGAWSLYRGLDDKNPRARTIVSFNSETPAWWTVRKGAIFQHGQLGFAPTANGTDEEDYLIGSPKDDVFTPGAGNDGLNGLEGYDVVRLPGRRSDHTITKTELGFRSEGPSGRKQLVGIEEIRFDAGGAVKLD